MTLFASVIALTCRLVAQVPEPVVTDKPAELPIDPKSSIEPTLLIEPLPPSEPAPLVEPVTELPDMPSPHLESITLFPNQGEIPADNSFNDQRFGYVLHGQIRAKYESNLFIQSTNEVEDYSFIIAPGFAVGFGDFKAEIVGADKFLYRFDQFTDKNYIFLDYAPSATWFVNNTDQDTVDHDVRLESEWTFQKLTVGVSGRYRTLNVPDEDIGDRVQVQRTTAAVLSRYQFSGKSSLEMNGYFTSSVYDGNFVDTKEWRNEDWLNYQILPKTQLGLGLTVGYLERSEGGGETFQQGKLRVRYEASEKLRVILQAGPQFRQPDEGSDQTDGIFSLAVAWQPTERAYVQIEGYRRTYPSGTAGDDYTATGVRLNYRHRIMDRLYLDLEAGYQNSDYDSDFFVRQDNLYFIRPSIGFGITSWMTCEVMGEFRSNDSTNDRRTFEATTVAVALNLLF